MVSKSRRDSVGGRGSSRIVPWAPKADATRFSGGVVPRFSGGGVVTFFSFPKGGLNRPLSRRLLPVGDKE